MTRFFVALLLAVGVPSAAFSDEDTQVGTGETWYTASIEVEEQAGTPESISAAHSNGISYSYPAACERGEGITGPDFYGCGGDLECGSNGLIHWVVATYPDGSTENLGEVCFEPSEVPVATSVTADAVLRAFERIPLPASEVVIQPPGGETLVNLDTVFSTRAGDFTRTVRLLGHRVELDITASEFRWVSGDGSTMRTDWSGRPWRAGTPMRALITHRYDDAQVGLRPRVDTTWSARYRVDGGPSREVPGTVTIQGTPYDLTVRSASPHLAG